MAELSINPWKRLWRWPRATFRTLLDEAPTYSVLTLAILGGIPSGLAQAIKLNAAEFMPLPVVLALSMLLGGLLGLLELYVLGWLIAFSGRWFGGQAGPLQIRAIVAWSNLPNVVGLLSWLVMLVLLGPDLFMPREPELMLQHPLSPVLMLASMTQVTLAIWSLVLMVIGVGVAQGFTLGKTLLSLVAPALGFALLTGMVGAVLQLLFA